MDWVDSPLDGYQHNTISKAVEDEGGCPEAKQKHTVEVELTHAPRRWWSVGCTGQSQKALMMSILAIRAPCLSCITV